MQRLGKAFFETKVEEIMSRNPQTISKDAKIVEAGEKMNHYSIHTLIVVEPSVVNGQQSVVGVVDSFSCLPGYTVLPLTGIDGWQRDSRWFLYGSGLVPIMTKNH